MISGRDLWFPNYVWTGEFTGIDNDALKTYGYEKIKTKYETDLAKDTRPWSSTDLYLEECPEVEKLVQRLDEMFTQVTTEVGFRKLQLYNIWINKNPPGVENDLHNHLHHAGIMGALFSGVYYVEADPELDQGDIVFERTDTSEMLIPKILITQNTPYNMPRARYKSCTSDFYIFSSWIPHRVTKNNSDKDRISISFNYGV